MKILVTLLYYRPYISGLTIYAERLARGLAARGHRVTVLTSQYEPTLPRRATLHGVQVVRVPVTFRLSKGVIMPAYGWLAWQLVREHDVLNLHLPQFEASGVALRGQALNKPVVLTYHTDLHLPPGLLNRFIERAVMTSNRLAARSADAITAYTRDFAAHSPYLSRYLHKVHVIPPPVDIPIPGADDVAAFRAHWNPGGKRLIGMATRLAAEKGVEVLLDALPRVLEEFPDAHILYAGQHAGVLGEEAYYRQLQPLFERWRDRITFLGILNPYEMSKFFSILDVLVVPSTNSTETFGLVQVEAMLCGTPSIASDLPGVRQPVRMTGMGEVVPIRDSVALADAIIRVLRERDRYLRPRAEIEALFSTERTAERYEQLFEELLAAQRRQVAYAHRSEHS
ncbi:MAG TPA: glycosyltransferase family 4 protein [Anaerolineae bacterium]|nr:glycosyltransferase family 4 protein [Anaerolineae bacterium]